MYENKSKQDSQLSQRDRAAGCVIVLAKSGRMELGTILYGHYTSKNTGYNLRQRTHNLTLPRHQRCHETELCL